MTFYIILIDIILLIVLIKYIMDTFTFMAVLRKENEIVIEENKKEKEYQFIKHLY